MLSTITNIAKKTQQITPKSTRKTEKAYVVKVHAMFYRCLNLSKRISHGVDTTSADFA